MNHKQAYEQEFDRIRREKMSDVMDVLAADIWSAMGRENESLFEQAAIDDDQGEMGRIMSAAISNCAHRLVNSDRVEELATTGGARSEDLARDNQTRLQDVREEARRATA